MVGVHQGALIFSLSALLVWLESHSGNPRTSECMARCAPKKKPAASKLGRRPLAKRQPLASKSVVSSTLGRKPLVKRQPLASTSVVRKRPAGLVHVALVDEAREELSAFIEKYGGWPSPSTRLGLKISSLILPDELSGLSVELVLLGDSTIKRADQFLNAVLQGKSTSSFSAWTARSRNRLDLKESMLSRAIAACNSPGRPPNRSLRNASDSKHHNPQIQQNMDIKKQTAVGVIPYTPQVVVNWLYQALVDVVVALQAVLGTSKFNQQGRLEHMVGECAGVGEVLLWWGTHLGSVREQAMIAWDYDVDLVVFVAAGTDIDMIWGAVCQPLAAHGYNMCKHSSFKFRVSPSDPLAWVPLESHVEDTAKKPHDSNCIDVEFYHVHPEEEMKIQGTQPFYLAPNKVFPTELGVFGPVSMPIPCTTDALQIEYGMTWRSCLAKIRSAGGGTCTWVEVPVGISVRRAVWPCVCLRNCENHMS